MNIFSKKLCLIVLCAMTALAGCAKKPVRPTPADTAPIGTAANRGINPESIRTDDLFAPGTNVLPERGNQGGFDVNNQLRGKFEPVYFDFDKSNIKESERVKLQAAAQYLRENPQHSLMLEGYCDWRGTAEYNLGLGDRRPNAAKSYLTTIGVPNDKVQTLSKGSLEAPKNADEATMARDRRVEIVILSR